MSASRSFEAFNPYSGKSKYFYLRDKYRHKKHHCHSCGANVPSTSNECHSCREKMARDHHQYEIIEADHNTNEAVSQDGDQYSFMDQESAEMIWVKESCNITVDSTDTQVGVSLQASLQLAITLVLNIAIGNTDRSEAVSQDLIQSFNADQINKQKYSFIIPKTLP